MEVPLISAPEAPEDRPLRSVSSKALSVPHEPTLGQFHASTSKI